MKFKSRMLPSYILLAALAWGAGCTILYLLAAYAGTGSLYELGGYAALGGMFIFPYSLTGFAGLLSFRFLSWGESHIPETVSFGVALGLLAIGIGRWGYSLNARLGPRAGWAFLAGVAVLGPLTIALVFIAADYLYPNTLPGLFRA